MVCVLAWSRSLFPTLGNPGERSPTGTQTGAREGQEGSRVSVNREQRARTEEGLNRERLGTRTEYSAGQETKESKSKTRDRHRSREGTNKATAKHNERESTLNRVCKGERDRVRVGERKCWRTGHRRREQTQRP